MATICNTRKVIIFKTWFGAAKTFLSISIIFSTLSSYQHAADSSHQVEEVDTLQEAIQEVIESSDKRSAKTFRPPGGVELGIVHMPPHLQDKDPMWSANEMRLL